MAVCGYWNGINTKVTISTEQRTPIVSNLTSSTSNCTLILTSTYLYLANNTNQWINFAQFPDIFGPFDVTTWCLAIPLISYQCPYHDQLDRPLSRYRLLTKNLPRSEKSGNSGYIYWTIQDRMKCTVITIIKDFHTE